MSKTIDERVVEMRFDNNNFEKNVQTSMDTLSKLKQSLKMDGAVKGLESVDKTARAVSFEKLLSGVESLQNRFSAFGIVGMRVLENVTDSMMNLANKTISFLSDSVVQSGINRAMNIENAHFMLQGLLKDEEMVQKIMSQASESVDGTAYSYDSAAKAASQFAASGVEAGDQMKTALRAITGVAAMTNSEYEGISQIFTTVAGNGRLMGDQLLQLSSRGLNAASTLADFFNGVRDGSKTASKEVSEAIKSILFDSQKASEDAIDDQKESLDKQYELKKKSYNKEYETKKKALEKSYEATVSSLEKEIETAEKTNEKRLNDVTKTYESDVAAYEKATEKKIALIDKEYNESLKLINEEEYRRIKQIDDQIHSINAQTEAEEKAREKAEREQKLAELQKAVNTAKSIEDREKAERALAEYTDKLAQKELEEQRKATIEDLKNQKQNIKDELSLKKEAAKEKHDLAIQEIKDESQKVLTSKEEQYKQEISALKESNAAQIKLLKLSNRDKLSALKESQAEELASYKSAQEEKIQVLKESIEKQKKELKSVLDVTEITEGDIRDLVTKGKISFDIFSAAMDDAFGEHAKKANETFTGSISNVKAALARIGAEFISPLIEQNGPLIKMLNELRLRINDVKKNIIPLAKTSTDTVKKIADSVANFLSKLDLTDFFTVFYHGVDILKNVLNGLWSVAKPIGEAFKDIFPPVASKKIVEITAKIKELTSQFKLNEKDSKNLRSTFKGLFAIIDIGKQAFYAIVSAILPVTPALGDVGSEILGVTGKIGEWLASLDDAIRKNNAFSNAIQKIKDTMSRFVIFITPAFEIVKKAIRGGIDSIKEFAKTHFSPPDTSGLDNFSEKMKERFEPITALFEGLKKLFTGLWAFFKKCIPVFATLAKAIGDALGGVGDAVSKAFGEGGFNGVIDLLNGGLLVGIGVGISKFIEHLQTVINKAGGMFSYVNRILFQLKNTLITFQAQLKASILMQIAVAVAILTASLIALSKIDSDKLNTGLTAITALFADLFITMSSFEKLMAGRGYKSLKNAGSAMIKMSAAVLILSSAMKTLSNVDPDSLNNALVAVTILIADLTGAAVALSKWGGKIQTGAAGMILFAVAIQVLAGAVKKLGGLDYDVLEKGLIAVGVVMGELAAFMAGAKFGSLKTGQGLAIIELSAALLILQKAVSAFGSMDAIAMIQGLGGVGAVLAEIAGFMKLMGDSKKMITTATGVTILGAAMIIFSNAVKGFAEMGWEELSKGLLGVGIALAMVAVAMNNMPATTPIIAAGMVLVGAALNVIASAVQGFSEMSWEEIAKSMVTLAGSLGVIVVTLKLMKKSLSGAAALLIVAGALEILAPVLKTFGKMSLAEIGKSMLVLAGAFTVLGVAGLLLEPVVPTILGLGAAVALLGVGALACGAGLLAIAAGLAALSVSKTAIIGTLVLAIEAVLSLIPQIAVKLVEGITAMIVAMSKMTPQIMEATLKIVYSVLKMLRETVPELVETILYILQEALKSMNEHWPTILEQLVSIVINVLKVIKDNIGEITTIVVDVILETLDAIERKLPDMMQIGIKIVISLIDGLAKGIEDNAPRIREALINLFKSLIICVLTFLGIHSPSTVFLDIGVNIIMGLINGIGQMLGSLLMKIGEVLSSMVSAIKNKVVEFKTKGQELMNNLKTGISEKLSSVKDAAVTIISNALTAIKNKVSEWVDIGKNLINGMKDGILSAASGVIEGAKGVVNGAVDAAKKCLGIASPSKVFAEIGRYCDQGLVQGFEKSADDVSKVSEKIGKQAIAGMSKSMDRLSDVIDFGIDSEPTIKPVLDLSNISNGIKDMDKMLYSQRSVELAENANLGMNSALERNQNEKAKPYNDSGVINEIGKLHQDISALAEAIAQMKLVMDTGTVVGALAGPMDSALGMRAAYGLRGN